jgi:hypothetical protein
MKYGKDTSRVLRFRLTRMFIGTFSTGTRTESWVETGHFLQGVRLMLEEIFETDGDGHITNAEYPCGYAVEGEAVPAQNTVGDYQFYNQHFRGKKSVAFLCGNQLWLFRSKYLGNKSFIDNRISIGPKHGYDSPRQQENISFLPAWIPGFEVFEVKNFLYKGHTMTYQKVQTLDFTNSGKIILTKDTSIGI